MKKSFFQSSLKFWAIGLLIIALIVGGVAYQPDFLKRLKLKSTVLTGTEGVTVEDKQQTSPPSKYYTMGNVPNILGNIVPFEITVADNTEREILFSVNQGGVIPYSTEYFCYVSRFGNTVASSQNDRTFHTQYKSLLYGTDALPDSAGVKIKPQNANNRACTIQLLFKPAQVGPATITVKRVKQDNTEETLGTVTINVEDGTASLPAEVELTRNNGGITSASGYEAVNENDPRAIKMQLKSYDPATGKLVYEVVVPNDLKTKIQNNAVAMNVRSYLVASPLIAQNSNAEDIFVNNGVSVLQKQNNTPQLQNLLSNNKLTDFTYETTLSANIFNPAFWIQLYYFVMGVSNTNGVYDTWQSTAQYELKPKTTVGGGTARSTPPPELTVVKDANPNSNILFRFTVDNGATPDQFDLSDSVGVLPESLGGAFGVAGTGNTQKLENIQAGVAYTITEEEDAFLPFVDGSLFPVPGLENPYILRKIECVRDDQTIATVFNTPPGELPSNLDGIIAYVHGITRNITVTLQPGDKVTCTFTNEDKTSTEEIVTRRIFVTDTTYAGGDINGIPGGNALCNQDARKGGLGSDGKWAFFGSSEADQSQSAQNAKDLLKDGIMYTRINRNRWGEKDQKDNDDGRLILGTKQDLLTKGPAHPVLRTPWGPRAQDRGMPYLYHQGNDGIPYTGSDNNGEVIAGKHCSGWTSSNEAGSVGMGNAHKTTEWLKNSEDKCSLKHPIYCVETDEPVVLSSAQAQVQNPGPTNPIVVGGGGVGLPPVLTPSHIIPPADVPGNTTVNVNGLAGIPSGKPPLPQGATAVDGGTFEVKVQNNKNLANGGLVLFRITIPEAVAKIALQKYYGYGSYSSDFWATPDLVTKLYKALKLYRFNEAAQQWEDCPGFAHVGLPNIFEVGCKGTSIFAFGEQQPPPAPSASAAPVITGGGGGGGSSQIIELREAEKILSATKTPQITPEPAVQEVKETKTEKPAALKIVFLDVSAKSKYFSAIEKVASLGIMVGSVDSKDKTKRVFKENNIVNRAELTTILVRWLFPGLHGAPDERSTCYFKDIRKSDWFAESVFVGCEQGLFKGYLDRSFRPTAGINLVEATKMIVEAASRKSPKNVGAILLKELAAAKKANEAWYVPYLRTAEKTKILVKEDLTLVKTFLTGPATRGWVAQAIANIPEL